MIAEIGHFSLVALVFASLLQSFSLWPRKVAYISCGLAVISFACLLYSHAMSDFSVQNVYQNSHTLKPLLYKVTGTWGNHEGSMLLWVLILALYGGAFAYRMRHSSGKIYDTTLRIQGLLSLGFASFVLFTSNPFIQLFPVPQEGLGLNPLLQDVGLAIHPPMLYLGYVGFSLVFSLSLAVMLHRSVHKEVLECLHTFTLFSWSALTLGIGLGSWWAYRELGWGGFWFWDPVENASLLPWLSATALVHSLIVSMRKKQFYGWTLFLGLLTFSLSLLGTFLVRSGVLTSVHAFANDPERGVFILAFLGVVMVGSMAVFAYGMPKLNAQAKSGEASTKSKMILVNNLFLMVACITVLLGTIYPLMLELIAQESVSVGAPYFNSTVVPLSLPMLFFAAIVPALGWNDGVLNSTKRYMPVLVLSIIITAVAQSIWPLSVQGFVAFVLAWFLIFAMAQLMYQKRENLSKQPWNFWGMISAHIGVGFMVLGITGASDWAMEKEMVMQQGKPQSFGQYSVTLNKINPIIGKNYIAQQGVIEFELEGREPIVLTPEKRFYPVENQQTLEAAIESHILYDTYAAMGESTEDKSRYGVRLYHRPLISWLWFGCIVMTLGGLLAMRRAK